MSLTWIGGKALNLRLQQVVGSTPGVQLLWTSRSRVSVSHKRYKFKWRWSGVRANTSPSEMWSTLMLLGGSQVSQLKNKNIYSLNYIPYSLYSAAAPRYSCLRHSRFDPKLCNGSMLLFGRFIAPKGTDDVLQTTLVSRYRLIALASSFFTARRYA